MSSVVGTPLADLCRESDPETVTAFVADLYATRGWTVDRQGDGRLVVSDGDHERRLAVVHPSESRAQTTGNWADTVVVPGDSVGETGDADVVDAAALEEQLAYAVDRPIARQLLRTHFGWTSPEQDGDDPARAGNVQTSDASGEEDPWWLPSGTSPGTDWAAVLPDSISGQTRLLFVGVLIVALAGGGVVALGGDADPLPGSAADAAGAGTNVSTPTLTPVPTAAPPVETPSPDGEGAGVSRTLPPPDERETSRYADLPPGVNRSGSLDPARFASAHRSALDNRSYRLTITSRQHVDGTPLGVYTETVRVVNATHYRVDVVRRGTLPGPTLSVSGTDMFADGSVLYVRGTDSVVDRKPTTSSDRFGDVQARYLEAFLEGQEAAVVDNRSEGRETFYIVTEGNRVPTLRNTTGSVVVTERGLVTDARWSYEFAGTWGGYDDVSGSFRLQVSDVGSTTVRQPAWMNSTAG